MYCYRDKKDSLTYTPINAVFETLLGEVQEYYDIIYYDKDRNPLLPLNIQVAVYRNVCQKGPQFYNELSESVSLGFLISVNCSTSHPLTFLFMELVHQRRTNHRATEEQVN